MQLVPRHKGTFRYKSASRIVAYHDTEAFPQPTIRHSDCELVLSREKGDRCFVCDGYRSNLHSLASREASYTTPNRTSHANYRYLSTPPEKIDRLHDLHRETRAYRLKVERLQASVTALHGVTLDEETTSDLHHIMLEEEEQAVQQDGIQKIFWQQHKEAASRSRESKKGMRWHPLMVRWCLFLRHQSNKCYETLRESGCIHLPSQRTLRDYTHYVQSGVGFSTEVDCLLLQAMNLMTCPEWHKLVILLLDEMHIREDLVYDKHTGKMIGFTNLGNINNHLLALEKSMDESEEEQESGSVLAKSTMAFMVLSESVSKALVLTGGEKAQETATFVSLFDKFFDMLSVSNFTIGLRKSKPFLQPFRSSKDSRLTWLEDEFLAYLDKWRRQCKQGKGSNKLRKS